MYFVSITAIAEKEILEKTSNIYPKVPDDYLSAKGLNFIIIKIYLNIIYSR